MDLYWRINSNKVEYKLTILILSLPNRLDKISELLAHLNRQAFGKYVQILYLGDNKSMKVGEKRNAILSLSKGRYITFIDDDDWVSDDYIDKILEAIEHEPEVITFRVAQFRDGEPQKEQRFYLHNGPQRISQPDRTHYKMFPNHLCVWRRDIVFTQARDGYKMIIREPFPHKNRSEDHEWAQAQEIHYSSIYEIPEVLYTYRFDRTLTETRK